MKYTASSSQFQSWAPAQLYVNRMTKNGEFFIEANMAEIKGGYIELNS